MSLVSLASEPCEEALAAKPQGDDLRGLLLAVASSSSLLAGTSGLLVEELLAVGGLLSGASGSSLLAGASGVLVKELLAVCASSSNLLASASGSSLLAGSSGLLGKELLAAGGLLALANGSSLLAYGLEVGHDIGHRIKVGGGGQMSRVPHLGRVWEGFSIH